MPTCSATVCRAGSTDAVMGGGYDKCIYVEPPGDVDINCSKHNFIMQINITHFEITLKPTVIFFKLRFLPQFFFSSTTQRRWLKPQTYSN